MHLIALIRIRHRLIKEARRWSTSRITMKLGFCRSGRRGGNGKVAEHGQGANVEEHANSAAAEDLGQALETAPDRGENPQHSQRPEGKENSILFT